MKTSLIIDLAGNLQARARQYGQALDGLAGRGRSAMKTLGSAAGVAGRGLDALGNRYTALLSGLGAAATVKGVVSLDARMTRLGITADVADDKVQALGESIYNAAQSPDIRVNPDQILAAVESVMEKTGDLKFAEENIRNIGLAIQASGADGAAIGDIFAEFQKQGMSAKDAFASVDMLIAQGKAGAFTLKDLASLGPRVVTAYTALGRSGPQAMKEMGAVLQLIRMGTGSSEQAATAWEAMLRVFSDKKKVAFLQKQGITLFDKEGNLRAANELMTDILKAAGNDAKNLSDVFDAEAIRAFNAILAELKKTGGVETLDKLMQISGDGTTVQQDSARAAKSAEAALTDLHTAWTRFADRKLTGPIRDLADALNSIGSDKAQAALDAAGTVGMALGGAYLLRKGYKGVQSVRGMFGKGGAAGAVSGGAMGRGLGGLPLPLPVYVVNDRMSLTDGALSDLVGGGGTKGKSGPASSAGKGAGKVGGRIAGRGGRMAGMLAAGSGAGRMALKGGGALAATVGVIEAGAVIMSPEATTDDKIRGVSSAAGGALGGWGGAAAGAVAGAAIGSVVPVIGTAIGGAIGGVLGGVFGEQVGRWIGDWVGDAVTGKDQAKEIGAALAAQNQDLAHNLASQTTVRIAVEGQANARVTSHNGPAEIDLYAGPSGGVWMGM